MSFLKTTAIQHLNASSPAINLTSSGEVGIGTISPSSPLHISKSTANTVPPIRIETSGSTDAFRRIMTATVSDMTAGQNCIYLFGQSESGYNSGYIGYKYAGASSSSSSMTFGLYGYDNLLNLYGGGQLTIPNQPMFYAYQGAAGTTTTGPIAFSSTRINIGNCYNTSNGRFTVPIAGNYIFYGHILHRGNGTSGNCEITFYKNGSNINTRGMAYSVASQSSGHIPMMTSVILPLAAGDYIQFGAAAVTSGSDIYLADNLSHFAGHLLG